MNFSSEIERMKVSNEAMFQLIRKTQNDVALMRARVDSFIDETNEICTIKEMVSRINKLENRIIMLTSKLEERESGGTRNIGLVIS